VSIAAPIKEIVSIDSDHAQWTGLENEFIASKGA
jgi:hypothetical protein